MKSVLIPYLFRIDRRGGQSLQLIRLSYKPVLQTSPTNHCGQGISAWSLESACRAIERYWNKISQTSNSGFRDISYQPKRIIRCIYCIRSKRWAIFRAPGNSAGRIPVQAGSALQRRNPLLLLLLFGLLLLRLATRQLLALLFQLPPRNSLLGALTLGKYHFPLPLLI